MPRKIAASYTKAPVWIGAMGDSHVQNVAYDVRRGQFLPDVLAASLADETGRAVAARNCGIDGDTTRVSAAGGTWPGTTGMRERFGALTRFGVPDLGIIYGGTNDYTAIVLGGSFAAYPGVTTATVSATVTKANLQWLGEQLLAAGCPRVLIGGYHLRNFASGGDVTSGVIDTEASLLVDPGAVFGASTRYAQYQAYLAVAAAYPEVGSVPRVVWCDFYAFLKTHLETEAPAQIGVDTYYHVATGNTHLNAVGCALLAEAMLEAMPEAWIEALAAA